MELASFNVTRAIQATAVLLKHAPRQLTTKLPLLKLLYLADRESIGVTGHPITGDKFAALKNGPIVSRIYNCIKDDDTCATEWKRYFACSTTTNPVTLIAEPGDGQLSNFEIELLVGVAEKFKSYSVKRLIDYTHELPEYKRNEPEGNSSNEISAEDILEALGMLDKKDALLAEAEAEKTVEKLLEAYRQ